MAFPEDFINAAGFAGRIGSYLGPRSNKRVLVDDDGNAITISHGYAFIGDLCHTPLVFGKAMDELSGLQHEKAGDGTTSVVLLACEMLNSAEAFIGNYHPDLICQAYKQVLEDALLLLDEIALTIDANDRAAMLCVVKSSIDTKVSEKGELKGELLAGLAVDGIFAGGKLGDVDIKVEKIAGGKLENSKLLGGVVIKKDVAARTMERKIKNPRIILLDYHLEDMCDPILNLKANVVITEKGVSDLACHSLSEAGVSAITMISKSDNMRIAKACGAVIVNRPDELQESDIGIGAGLFEVKRIGSGFFTFIVDCEDPKALSLLLRSPSGDLDEMERHLQTAIAVSRHIIASPKVVPGGGAVEMAVSARLKQKCSSFEGIEREVYEAASKAFEAIPQTLAKNSKSVVDEVQTMIDLKEKHAIAENGWIGLDSFSGEVGDMKEKRIWDCYMVKKQCFTMAIEGGVCKLIHSN